MQNLYHYRKYIWQNAWQDLRHRYAGSAMGATWNLLLPLTQILIYALVFSQIMRVRGASGRANYDFILYLCCGLFPWFTFSNAVTRGSMAIYTNARYLTKLPIPEEIFVAKLVLAETFILMVYLMLLVVIGPFMGQPWGWSNVLLPLVAILFQALGFGLALLLASVIVFFQDLSQVFGIIIRMWMWLTPIIYVETILSERALSILRWNPAYFFIKSFRDLFLFNQIPPWSAWSIMIIWVAGFVFLATWVLQVTRPKLRDLL
ncbi:MAG: ABC transporter permease [Anaerolineae bacterium]|nr:ABC transporter permease [Anaerolineae bacterium]